MTFTENPGTRNGGARAFLGRRLRDALVLTAGAVLALPLIVPFA